MLFRKSADIGGGPFGASVVDFHSPVDFWLVADVESQDLKQIQKNAQWAVTENRTADSKPEVSALGGVGVCPS